jgi:hypothetical protein
MELYGFCVYAFGENSVGVIRANSEEEAHRIFKEIYHDIYEFCKVTITKVKFKNDVCEIYYGC